ncbi:hypothetical protein VNO77_17243 [Canavalia gladiata]|uniref:Uncharacterized protein n=1 Tax=Canavalia gladiata TaxID=3824 RepID=A0AAN9LME1_CANGL
MKFRVFDLEVCCFDRSYSFCSFEASDPESHAKEEQQGYPFFEGCLRMELIYCGSKVPKVLEALVYSPVQLSKVNFVSISYAREDAFVSKLRYD